MIKNEAERKKPASISLSANDQKLIVRAVKIMDRSRSSMIMVLVKRYLEKQRAGLL